MLYKNEIVYVVILVSKINTQLLSIYNKTDTGIIFSINTFELSVHMFIPQNKNKLYVNDKCEYIGVAIILIDFQRICSRRDWKNV